MNANSLQMKIDDWLACATEQLKTAGISTARLDCLVLLEDATGKDRSWLLAHPDHILPGSIADELQEQVERRSKHEPLAYIRGRSEFYGREFLVTPDTLEPRPETETMVALALQVIGDRLRIGENLTLVDIGTGSGCLAITIKLEIPNIEVVAVDISDKCIKVAQENAKKLRTKIEFYTGNLLEPIYNLQPTTYNLVLANLPYVPDGHTINQAAMFEPKHAIFGGSDGLDIYRKLFKQIMSLSHKPEYILTESLPFQHKELTQIAKEVNYKLKTSEDFIQVFQRD